MGGFHGGHSSGGSHGGGFHGGHSSHTPAPVTRYHHGRVYVAPVYGSANGKPMGFFGSMILSCVFLFVGLILFLALFTIKTTATVTNTYTDWDLYGERYEVYDFTYKINGHTYNGHGDDDLKYEGYSYVYTVNVGEKYPIYARMLNHHRYEFKDNRFAIIMVTSLFEIAGIVILITSIQKKRKHDKDLAEIGDVNGDGKVDEDDFNSLPTSNPGTKKCPYCDSTLPTDATECPNCGAKNI